MLKLASKHYLKSVGDKFFVANPDYLEWTDVKCLDVVIKRRPKWFWQKTKYTYSHFGLNDLLTTPISLDDKKYFLEPENITPDYKYNLNHDIDGKIGAKIASLAMIDVIGSDTINVIIDFQGMVKYAINYSEVQKMLKTKKVNLNGELIKNLAQNRYNVVCLVSQYITISKDTEIDIVVNRGFDEDIKDKFKDLSISEDGKIKSVMSRKIKFLAGTRLAFDFIDCLIMPDGSIHMIDRTETMPKTHMIPHLKEATTVVQLPNYCAHITMDPQESYDIPDATDNLESLWKQLDYLKIHNNQSKITRHLINLRMDKSKPSVFEKLELFMMFCEQAPVNSTVNIAKFNQFTEDMLQNDDLKCILKQIGVDSSNNVKVDQVNLDFIKALSILMEALTHIQPSQVESLYQLVKHADISKQNIIGDLCNFLKNVKFTNNFDSVLYETLVQHDNVKHILMSIGINERGINRQSKSIDPLLTILHAL